MCTPINTLREMNNLAAWPPAAGAIYRGSWQALTTQNIKEFLQPLFDAVMYLNKDSVYSKKYIIILPTIIFIIIIFITLRM